MTSKLEDVRSAIERAQEALGGIAWALETAGSALDHVESEISLESEINRRQAARTEERLRDAAIVPLSVLRAVLSLAEDVLEDIGPCDHTAGICACEWRAVVADFAAHVPGGTTGLVVVDPNQLIMFERDSPAQAQNGPEKPNGH